MPQGGARGQNPGQMFVRFLFSFIESFVFEHQVLLGLTQIFCVTSDLWFLDPEWD